MPCSAQAPCLDIVKRRARCLKSVRSSVLEALLGVLVFVDDILDHCLRVQRNWSHQRRADVWITKSHPTAIVKNYKHTLTSKGILNVFYLYRSTARFVRCCLFARFCESFRCADLPIGTGESLGCAAVKARPSFFHFSGSCSRQPVSRHGIYMCVLGYSFFRFLAAHCRGFHLAIHARRRAEIVCRQRLHNNDILIACMR